jgi:hypothetical protein
MSSAGPQHVAPMTHSLLGVHDSPRALGGALHVVVKRSHV